MSLLLSHLPPSVLVRIDGKKVSISVIIKRTVVPRNRPQEFQTLLFTKFLVPRANLTSFLLWFMMIPRLYDPMEDLVSSPAYRWLRLPVNRIQNSKIFLELDLTFVKCAFGIQCKHNFSTLDYKYNSSKLDQECQSVDLWVWSKKREDAALVTQNIILKTHFWWCIGSHYSVSLKLKKVNGW